MMGSRRGRRGLKIRAKIIVEASPQIRSLRALRLLTVDLERPESRTWHDRARDVSLRAKVVVIVLKRLNFPSIRF
jgi:hypothetical protein